MDAVTLKYLPFKDVVGFGKELLLNANAQIRACGLEFLRAVYAQLGPSLFNFTAELTAAQLKTLQAECEKTSFSQ